MTNFVSCSLVGGLAVSLAYGIPTKPVNDPHIRLAEDAIGPAGRAVIPGAYLVDVFPFLRHIPEWVPGAKFQRDARIWREMMQRYKDGPFDEAELLIVSQARRFLLVEGCKRLKGNLGQWSGIALAYLHGTGRPCSTLQ